MMVFAAAFASLALLASDPVPRVTFVRTEPAEHNSKGADTVCVLYRLGDSRFVDAFVEHLEARLNSSGSIVASAVPSGDQHIVGEAPVAPAAATHIQRHHPARLYLGVKEFSCGSTEKSGERSVHDPDGKRVRLQHVWVESLCHARVDVIEAATLKRTGSFYVRGQGASPRVETLSAEEARVALEHATRAAAMQAAEKIAPRRFRDRLELEADAPDFDRIYVMVERGDLADARAAWQVLARQLGNYAPLQYNLGALSEALGENEAALAYYAAAEKLQPANARYRKAGDALRRRIKKTPPEGGAARPARKPIVRIR